MDIPIQLEMGAKLPQKATEGAGAYDLHALYGYKLRKPGMYMIRTGLSLAIPKGMNALILARSSLHKRGLRLANGVGLVDSDYRGELLLAIEFNGFAGYEKYETVIQPGERLAQLLFIQTPNTYLDLTAQLTPTARNTGGFGSTGM